jgi:hypothetical protein
MNACLCTCASSSTIAGVCCDSCGSIASATLRMQNTAASRPYTSRFRSRCKANIHECDDGLICAMQISAQTQCTILVSQIDVIILMTSTNRCPDNNQNTLKPPILLPAMMEEIVAIRLLTAGASSSSTPPKVHSKHTDGDKRRGCRRKPSETSQCTRWYPQYHVGTH